MLAIEKVVSDFNIWLVRKHAFSRDSEFKFSQLTALIDQFRMENYPTLSATDVPEVAAIESAVRSRWGTKGAKTRKSSAEAKRHQKRKAEEAARQLKLPL